jgi:hypothetical protein
MRTLVSSRTQIFRAVIADIYAKRYTVEDCAAVLNDRRYGLLVRAAALRKLSRVYAHLPFTQSRQAAKRQYLR